MLPTFRRITVPSTLLLSCRTGLSIIVRHKFLHEFKSFYVALCLWASNVGRFGVSPSFLMSLDCLTLKMKATHSYETSGTATPPTGCHIPTAVRTSNLKSHNHLRLAQCNIPEKANLNERRWVEQKVWGLQEVKFRDQVLWRTTPCCNRHMKTDVSANLSPPSSGISRLNEQCCCITKCSYLLRVALV